MPLIRLDKLICATGYGSRREAKDMLKKGLVKVDGIVLKKSETKIDTNINIVTINDEKLEYSEFIYLMMNKPSGVISATDDPYDEEKTVIDLLSEKHKRLNLFPVGRLDKDTEGLLLITNDGNFAHKTLSPKKHVSKVYYAKICGQLSDCDVNAFANGIDIKDKKICKPAILTIQSSSEISEALIEISEGKYHQIKRMFEAIGKKVIFLKRIRFANIDLDEKLDKGKYRELNEQELEVLKTYRGLS